jgi:hypothetical protein
MKAISIRVSGLFQDIICVLLGLIGFIGLRSMTTSGTDFFGRIVLFILSILFISIGCLSLIQIVSGRFITFFINEDVIGWRLVFSKWKKVKISDISSIEMFKSTELSGGITIFTKSGTVFHIPGNCYECRLIAVEKALRDLSKEGIFQFHSR